MFYQVYILAFVLFLKWPSVSHKEHSQTVINLSVTAQIESLRADLRTARSELLQATRGQAQLEGAVESLSSQLRAKEQAVVELQEQVDRLSKDSGRTQDLDKHYQQKVDHLMAEVMP